MTRNTVCAVVLAAGLITGGCATKGFVRQNTEPLQKQLDEVAAKQAAQGETLDKTRQELGETKIVATEAKDNAKVADARALDAQSKAEGAGAKANQNARDIEALSQVVKNFDDFSIASEAAVYFATSQDTLTEEGRRELDKVAAARKNGDRFFVAVEGFTDSTGSADYNLQLSQRRAERVVQYMVAKHNIPVYRVFKVGLGAERPADEAKTREARARNRRVEVRLYTAAAAPAAAASAKANN